MTDSLNKNSLKISTDDIEKRKERLTKLYNFVKNKNGNKKFLNAINREKELTKIIAEANFAEKAESFTQEEQNAFKSALGKIIKDGKVVEKQSQRVSIAELKVLAKFNRIVTFKLNNALKDTTPCKKRDYLSFLHDRGKKSEAGITGRTLKETKYWFTLASIAAPFVVLIPGINIYVAVGIMVCILITVSAICIKRLRESKKCGTDEEIIGNLFTKDAKNENDLKIKDIDIFNAEEGAVRSNRYIDLIQKISNAVASEFSEIEKADKKDLSQLESISQLDINNLADIEVNIFNIKNPIEKPRHGVKAVYSNALNLGAVKNESVCLV